MKTKICSKCHIEKPLSEFYKILKDKFKIRSICKECLKSPNKKRKEELFKQNKKQCSKCYEIKDISDFHKQKIGSFGILSTCKDCEKIVKKNSYLKYQVKNQQYAKEYKNNNKEKRNKYRKYRRKTDINFKIRMNLRCRTSQALKRNSKSKSTLNLLGCSVEFLKKHLESKFKDGMSWNNYGFYGWHIDHIKPCASFDLSKSEEQKKCFHYSNLQPLWMKDNLIKSQKCKEY